MMYQLQDLTKGWVFLLGGLILFLYALGIFSWRLVLIIVALYLIYIGFQQMGGIKKIQKMMKKPPQQQQ